MQSESRVDISKQTLNPGKPTVPTYKQGNLLIQLLAAMVIMGIIMAFTLPNINTYTDRANETQVLMDFKEFQLAAILLNTENGYPKFNTLDTFLGKLNENLEVDYKFSLTPDGKQAVSNLKDPYDYTYKLLFKDNLEDRSVSIIFTSTGGTRVGKSLSLRNFKDKALATSGEISYTLSAKLYGKGKIVELTTMEEEALLGQAPPSKPDGGNKPTPTSNPTPPPTSTPPPINPIAPPIPGDSPNLYPGKIVGIVGDGGLYSYYYSSKVYGEDGWVHSPYANEYSGVNELYHHQNDASGEKLQTVLKQWGGRIPQPEKYKMSNLFINCNFGKLNIDFTGWDLTSKVSTDLCKKSEKCRYSVYASLLW